MALCLVTGGAGFIGSHLVEALVHRGETVRVLDNFSTGRLANLSRLPSHVELFWCDFCDTERAREALCGVDWVFHQALSASPEQWAGARRFFESARDAGVKRVVAAVPTDAGPEFDTTALVPADLDVVWLRYATVLGPSHAPTDDALRRVLDGVTACENLPVPSDGTIDVIDVADVVEANLRAATAPRLRQRLYPVRSERPVTWPVLVDLLGRLANAHRSLGSYGLSAPINLIADHWSGDCPDDGTDFGFRPLVSLDRCLWRYLTALPSDGPDARGRPTLASASPLHV